MKAEWVKLTLTEERSKDSRTIN